MVRNAAEATALDIENKDKHTKHWQEDTARIAELKKPHDEKKKKIHEKRKKTHYSELKTLNTEQKHETKFKEQRPRQ